MAILVTELAHAHRYPSLVENRPRRVPCSFIPHSLDSVLAYLTRFKDDGPTYGEVRFIADERRSLRAQRERCQTEEFLVILHQADCEVAASAVGHRAIFDISALF